jgi:hypothetical protein
MGSHSSLGSYGPPVLTQFSRSPTQISREPTPPIVPERFVPGKETESVLKITKRPKLRPKDLSHRQSLDGGVPIPPSFEEPGIVSPAPFFTPGYPPRYQPREVRPSTSEWERPLMVTLLVGRHQLVLHGSMGMPVDELRRRGGCIAPWHRPGRLSCHLVSGLCWATGLACHCSASASYATCGTPTTGSCPVEDSPWYITCPCFIPGNAGLSHASRSPVFVHSQRGLIPNLACL